jgi:hypothetical protein
VPYATCLLISDNSGHQEWITLSGVQYVLEMDSYDERMQEMVNKVPCVIKFIRSSAKDYRNKENEAKERAKLKVKHMETERKESQRRSNFNGPSSSSIGGGSNYGSSQSPYSKLPTSVPTPVSSSSAGNTYR